MLNSSVESEKQAGNKKPSYNSVTKWEKSITESSLASYKGYSFYNSMYENDAESEDCSMLSTEYKVSDKINDLNIRECAKETRLQLSNTKMTFTISPDRAQEKWDKQVVSVEPTVVKPRVGKDTKTIRERNLEDYIRENDSRGLFDAVPNPTFINEFLESFDTSKWGWLTKIDIEVQDIPEMSEISFQEEQSKENVNTYQSSSVNTSNVQVTNHFSRNSNHSNAHSVEAHSKYNNISKKLNSFKINLNPDAEDIYVWEINLSSSQKSSSDRNDSKERRSVMYKGKI